MTALRLATLPPLAAAVAGYRWHGPLWSGAYTRSRPVSGSIVAEPRIIPRAAMAARRHRLTWVAVFALPLFGLALGIAVAALVAPELNYLAAAFGAANLLASAILSIGYAMPAFLLPPSSGFSRSLHSLRTTSSCRANECDNSFSASKALNKG